MLAKFEVRRLELVSARKILGTAIGMCPKEALFKGYIDLEVEVSIYLFQSLHSYSRTKILFSFVNSTVRGHFTKNTLRQVLPGCKCGVVCLSFLNIVRPL